MKTQTRTWQRLSAAIVVAIGIAVVWGILAMWIASFLMLSSRANGTYENIVVMQDGTPLIESRSYTNYANVSYRTLEGKPVDAPDDNKQLLQASFTPPRKPPGLFETNVNWSSRIFGLTDSQRRPTLWYFIRSDEPIGSAYFMGFDQESKMPVGYLSRGGFSPVIPPRDQWFDVGRFTFDWAGSGSVIASTGEIRPNSQMTSFNYSRSLRQQPPQDWMVYLVDGEHLRAVDLRTRTVQTIYESPGIVGADILYELPKDIATNNAAKDKTAAPADGDPATEQDEPVKWVRRLAVRKTDRLAVLDFSGKVQREYPLTEPMRRGDLTIAALKNDELLARWYKGNDRESQRYELAWIRPDGSVAREAEAQLAVGGGEDERTMAWFAAPAAPVPIGWITVTTLIAPTAMMQSNHVATLPDAWAEVFRFAGLPLLAVLALGVILAWLTLRLQRKYHRRASAVWAVFVFLFGASGFIAYLIEHRRAKLETCGDCGKVVPRDRESCAACKKEFATPPPIGTEIFA